MDNNSKGAFRKRRQRPKKIPQRIVITSAYLPVEGEEQEGFNEYLNSFYLNLPKNSILLHGQDFNAALGTSMLYNSYGNTLGTFGIERQDQ